MHAGLPVLFFCVAVAMEDIPVLVKQLSGVVI